MGALDGKVTQYEGSNELVPGITSLSRPLEAGGLF
jgi:hypothetical protein